MQSLLLLALLTCLLAANVAAATRDTLSSSRTRQASAVKRRAAPAKVAVCDYISTTGQYALINISMAGWMNGHSKHPRDCCIDASMCAGRTCGTSDLPWIINSNDKTCTPVCATGFFCDNQQGLCAECTTSFAATGSDPGQTSGYVYEVLPMNDNSTVLVTDWSWGVVEAYSVANLSYIGRWATRKINGAMGIAQAPGAQGNVFISTTDGSGNIYEFTSSRAPVAAHSLGIKYGALSMDGPGVLYGATSFVSPGFVTRWDVNSNFAAKKLQPPDADQIGFSASGVAVDRRNGHVLSGDIYNERIAKFNCSGGFMETINLESLENTAAIIGVAIDAAGNMYIPAIASGGQLRKYDSSGRLLATYNGALTNPSAVAVGADGTVWVPQQLGSVLRIRCF